MCTVFKKAASSETMKAIFCLAVVALISAVCAQQDPNYDHARELAAAALVIQYRASTCACKYVVYRVDNLMNDDDYSNIQFDLIVLIVNHLESGNEITYESCAVSAAITDSGEDISLTSCTSITEEEAGEGDSTGQGGGGNGDGGDGTGDGGDGTGDDGGADGGDEGGQ
ncbi:hypothetical protein L9F63_017882 [Diploptera punctata]|uniref:Uncharacterized protein n=1 Tax=Diploptera punctata TaxID=6984 RepID=A0AAD7ZXU3_DIPPU|nr:hypothetical protein L9F63_017882 [Diploptera punctata]